MTTPANPVSPQPHQGTDAIDHPSGHTTPPAPASIPGVIPDDPADAYQAGYDFQAGYDAGHELGVLAGRNAAAADIWALVLHVRAIRDQLGDESMRRIGWGGYLEALTAAHEAAHGEGRTS